MDSTMDVRWHCCPLIPRKEAVKMRKILVACVLAVGMVLFAVGCEKSEPEPPADEQLIEETAADEQLIEETAATPAEKRAEKARRDAALEREKAAE